MPSGIRVNQRYIKTQAFQELGIQEIKRVHPLCAEHGYDSDEYWRCFLRTDTLVHHPTSSCKMGRREDKTTVVDAQLRLVCFVLFS